MLQHSAGFMHEPVYITSQIGMQKVFIFSCSPELKMIGAKGDKRIFFIPRNPKKILALLFKLCLKFS
jgi:hypothetical protein